MDLLRFKYTLKHKSAFLRVEKELLGRNTIAGYFHDCDKLVLFLIPFVKKDTVTRIHRKRSKHHIQNAKTERQITQAIIDWECARYTKPDKPLDAFDTMKKHYPSYESKVLPVLKKLGLPSE
jgi:hypothetical protein